MGKEIDVFTIPVFQIADIFPMMPEDELQELAADIKENGLHDPLKIADIDGKPHLIDGRNRRAACQIAGVDPIIEHVNGADLMKMVISANLRRRHMSKGARAMAEAMMTPKPTMMESGARGGRGKKKAFQKMEGFSSSLLGQARFVLEYEPTLATNIISGAMTLTAAVEKAKKTKSESATDEDKLAALALKYPDLAARVVDGELSLSDAQEQGRIRDAQYLEQCRTAAMLVEQFAGACRTFAVSQTDWLSDPSVDADALSRLGGEAELKMKIKEINTGMRRLSLWLTSKVEEKNG